MDFSSVTISTYRLKLIPLSEDYASEIFKEFTEEITKYMFPMSPKRIEDTLQYINSTIPKITKGEELHFIILNKKHMSI